MFSNYNPLKVANHHRYTKCHDTSCCHDALHCNTVLSKKASNAMQCVVILCVLSGDWIALKDPNLKIVPFREELTICIFEGVGTMQNITILSYNTVNSALMLEDKTLNIFYKNIFL